MVKERTFIIKAVYPVDTSAFMVPSQYEEVFGVFDLVRKEQTDGFEGLFTAIYVVAKKEIVCFRREAAVLEEPEEIVILTMDVAWSYKVKN